jgi:hypothetical protein
MRPYLAIIKDSFREALDSRVLWVFTGLIVVVLLALAPIGYKENLTGEFTWGDIVDAPQLVERMRRESTAEQPSPGKRIWSLLDDNTKTSLSKLERIDADGERKPGEGRDLFRGSEALRKELNKLLARRDFYREEDWKDVSLPKEAKDLLERPIDSLSKEKLIRLNRLLVETPFHANFAWRSQQSISVAYGGFATDPLPFTKKQVDSVIRQWILTTTMGWIVGVFGMIAAILVTSTIIPQMLEPGSITLLLSKPVSRSLLLTAKFFGACAFIFLNVTLLIVGLWLIAGTRLGIWNQGMLWCIPIFLFMFLIYYAVSALTGLIWKSAIISVVITVLFWITCFVVDLVHDVMEGLLLAQQRITRIVEATSLGRRRPGLEVRIRSARRTWHSHHRWSLLPRAQQAAHGRAGLPPSVRLLRAANLLARGGRKRRLEAARRSLRSQRHCRDADHQRPFDPRHRFRQYLSFSRRPGH